MKKKEKPGASDPTSGDSLFRAAMAASPDAFLAIDEADRIVVWSPRAEAMLGWTAAHAIGCELGALALHESCLAAYQEALRQLRNGEPVAPVVRHRVIARRRDGDRFAAELQLMPVDIDGQRRLAGFLRDISTLAQAEQQLVQAQKLEAMGHLTGGLAHDFNNILGIVIGSLDLVLPTLGPGQERELVEAALAAAHRGADVTRALLAMARRRAVSPQATDVNRLLEEITPLLRQTAGRRVGIEFSPHAGRPICHIDPGGLGNALVNLVINARDAMPDGGRILVYVYSMDILPLSLMAPLELAPGPYLVIGVDDSGQGMSPEVATRAFDPFFTTKERGQGTGLGLAMVYGFARQSGGTATIQSAPGRGTSIQLLIPVMADGAAIAATSSC